MDFKSLRAEATELDSQNPLAGFRDRFFIPDQSVIYMDGNSLGRLPLQTREKLIEEIEFHWGDRLIRSWNEEWYNLPVETGNRIAKLIGAKDGEVVVSDSTSVNLYKLASAALKARPERRIILSDSQNFPSDLYILQGIATQSGPGFELKIIDPADPLHITEADFLPYLNDQVALVVLSHVTFKHAFLYDMKKLTAMVQQAGALMLWDLSHSVGALPIFLNDCHVDLAVGCTYKYLNGGPGAPAFLYVRSDLLNQLEPPIQGWFGHSDPFAFGLSYQPAPGIRRFLTGTPPVLSLAAIRSGVDLLLEAGLDEIRNQSISMTDWFIHQTQKYLSAYGFRIATPHDPAERGSHVSLSHPDAFAINLALINGQPAIIPDFRKSDIIRFGITPLYTTWMDLAVSVERLNSVCEFGNYQSLVKISGSVT